MQLWEIEDDYYLHLLNAHNYRFIPHNSRPQFMVSIDPIPCPVCMRFNSQLRDAVSIPEPNNQ